MFMRADHRIRTKIQIDRADIGRSDALPFFGANLLVRAFWMKISPSFCRSSEVVFFLADDEDGTRRRSDDAFGRAADRKMFPAGVTVSSEND